jgi:hypothetical protein
VSRKAVGKSTAKYLLVFYTVALEVEVDGHGMLDWAVALRGLPQGVGIKVMRKLVLK